jgi:hypothetical protein
MIPRFSLQTPRFDSRSLCHFGEHRCIGAYFLTVLLLFPVAVIPPFLDNPLPFRWRRMVPLVAAMPAVTEFTHHRCNKINKHSVTFCFRMYVFGFSVWGIEVSLPWPCFSCLYSITYSLFTQYPLLHCGPLIVSWPQLSRDVPANGDFRCVETAMLRDMRKWTPLVSSLLSVLYWLHNVRLTVHC